MLFRSFKGLVWGACLIAKNRLLASLPQAAAEALDRVQSHVAPLEHPELRDAGILDTAATYYERRADIAKALNQPAALQQATQRAAALRARIAEIEGT